MYADEMWVTLRNTRAPEIVGYIVLPGCLLPRICCAIYNDEAALNIEDKLKPCSMLCHTASLHRRLFKIPRLTHQNERVTILKRQCWPEI